MEIVVFWWSGEMHVLATSSGASASARSRSRALLLEGGRATIGLDHRVMFLASQKIFTQNRQNLPRYPGHSEIIAVSP